MADIKTEFCGLPFDNPVIVPAGAHGRDAETIISVGKAGASAVCTKTITSQAPPDVKPCFSAVKAGMVNSVFGSDKAAEYWFTEGISKAKEEGKAYVIANLAGFSPEEAAELARKAVGCGADMIEMPTHCPHMGEILTAMFPGLNMPEPKLTDLDPMKRSVELIKKAVDVPVIVKLSGSFSNIVKEWALGVKDSGADAIACSDAFGPALSIDIRTGQPALGGPRGVGGLTGPAIMPITLRMVMEIAMTVDLPIIGVGGVSSAEDVLQYIMAGATLVGVCTHGHMKGLKSYSKLIKNIGKVMDDNDYDNLDDIRGLTIRKIDERSKTGKTAVTQAIVPDVNHKRCTLCKKCEQVCVYDAIVINKKVRISEDKCYGCGLCVSLCPTNALSQAYY
ncbi:MAG: 4Fe-4S binding protein [Spirochaetales bacterium]|nr:4Fe-4S binding protein [Spirochaetales bacterium]